MAALSARSPRQPIRHAALVGWLGGVCYTLLGSTASAVGTSRRGHNSPWQHYFCFAVSRPVVTSKISGELVFLGTGTSVGVPAIGCGCDVCQSGHPRNQRTRCGLALGLPEGVLLVDTPPDLRQQLLREGIGVAHAILYTHEHVDHVYGLDDVRLFQFYLGAAVPLYCEQVVEERIRKSFDFAFDTPASMHAGGAPRLEFHRIGTSPFELLGAQVIPIRLRHGPNFDVLGFRFGNVAYCTDVKEIPQASMALLQDLDVLVLDALRLRPHETHLSLDEAVALAEQLGPRQTLFTHVSHELDYETTNQRLPANMQLAYDGLRVPLT